MTGMEFVGHPLAGSASCVCLLDNHRNRNLPVPKRSREALGKAPAG